MKFQTGIMEKKVAACAACHGPGGVGNAQAGFPRINGQSVGYTIEQEHLDKEIESISASKIRQANEAIEGKYGV